MSIVQNTVSEIGDVLLIHPTNPVTGLSALSGFTDVVGGEIGTRFFTKEFRWSVNGFIWTSWIELTDLNLQGLSLTETNPFYIQYRYTRAGTDPTGFLTFTSIALSGTYVDLNCGPVFANSIFSEFFTCCCSQELLGWCENVLEKLYKQGLVPKYITRGDETGTADEDYLAFWRAVACYFAIFVRYARVFEDYYDTKRILGIFLEQRDMVLCRDESLAQLQFLASNYLTEIGRRGTQSSFAKTTNNSPSILGEVSRLICRGDTDEYIHTISQKQYVGLNVGNGSPMYRGVDHDPAFWRGYEVDPGLTTEANYPTIGSGHSFGSDQCVLPAGAGFGSNSVAGPDGTSGAIIVSPNLDYYIELVIQCAAADSDNLTVGVLGLNAGEILLPGIDGSAASLYYIQGESVPIGNQTYRFRFHIYNASESQQTTAQATLDGGTGVHKQMTSAVAKLIPIVRVTDEGVGNDSSWTVIEYKFGVLRTPYSRGFIHTSKILELFLKQNNTILTNQEVTQVLRDKFVPYNTALIANYL